MTNNNVRSYEVSIWTLQDSFITVLKPSNLEHKSQIQEAKMSLKDDGTQELTFSLPMYLYEDGTKRENPIWYNVLNGTIIADLRKVKVIFNKGTVDEGVFEFIITKVTERHEDDQLFCDVECEGLAFHELGKIGYKISLNSGDYEEEYGEWAIDPDRSTEEPKNNIDYWMNKVLHSMSKWTYSVCMDWTAFDGTLIYGYTDDSGRVNYAWTNKDRTATKSAIPYSSLPEDERISLNNRREAAGLRRYDKIYEEPYVSSWTVNENNNQLTPGTVEPMREKLRLLDIEESNIYNITQTIAETFGVFCKYVYHYDENYHIIGREIVFYNNFVQESTGTIDLTYPYHTNSISREMDATDTISKMFVKPLANDSFSTGYANIMDAAANKSGEDYLLNFAYLYSIGTITEQQYTEVENYELEMKKLNLQMIPLERELVYLRAQLPEKEAKLTVTQNSITLAKDRISAADDLLNSILNGETQVNITAASPEICYPIRTSTKDSEYYIRLTKAGILINTIRIYTSYASNNSTLSNPVTEYFDPIADEFGNLEKLILNNNEHYAEKYYVTYGYVPDLVQKNVKKTYEIRLNRDLAQEQALTDEIEQIKTDIEEKETEYNELVEQKKILITQFENMMGPALREGFWQPEDEYTGYGDKYAPDNVMFSFVRATRPEFSDDLFSLGFDDTPFDDEPVNYYSLGVNIEDKHYYPLVNISGLIQDGTLNKTNFDKISYIYKDSNAAVGNFSRIWTIGSQCQVIFARNTEDNVIAPYLMLTGAAELSDSELTNVAYRNNAKIGIYANGEIDELSNNLVFVALADLPKRQIVYPRFKINSLELQNSDTDLSIMQLERDSSGNTAYTQLTNFEDYSVLIRDDAYYITVKPLTMMKSGLAYSGSESLKYRINYTISNSALLIYLDAIQVLKENAFPKVAYDITPSLVNKDFTRVAYKGLDKIAHINDYELKFENVLGYISEMDLDLDMPANDTYSIKNYKTKFEDLFSTIVAQTEEMKKNSAVIGIAAGAFTSSGELKAEQVQSVMNRVDLNYAFNQGTLTIDEANGIWGTSDSGVVAFRGGGIFTATQKDADDNWIWNTGILPSGINASLITTGQLDTNLIRIFAGDNIAFQMNADGLYAYKWDLGNVNPTDATQPNRNFGYQKQYVVHNKEGLFLHADAGAEISYFDENNIEQTETLDQAVDRVAITWDGLSLSNYAGERVFYADADSGNLNIKGKLTATSLTIESDGEDVGIDQYIQDKVDVDVDIDVGGTNLLRKTKEFTLGSTINDWSINSSYTTRALVANTDFYSLTMNVTGDTSYTWKNFVSPVFALGNDWIDKSITVSGWIYSSNWSSIDQGAYITLNFGTGNRVRTKWTDIMIIQNGGAWSSNVHTDSALTNNKWLKFSCTAKIQANISGTGTLSDCTQGFLTAYLRQNGNISFYGLKAEWGTVATAWSPAPEDTNAAISDVNAVANSRRRVFTLQPVPPYDVGDLWVNGVDIKYCKTARASGSFTSSDWVLASNYTDDTTANKKPNVIITDSSGNIPTGTTVKAGDILIDASNNNRTSIRNNDNNAWIVTSAGGIKNTSLTVDPITGYIGIIATNYIDIAADKMLQITTNGSLVIAGGTGVTIGSNSKIAFQAGSGTSMELNTNGATLSSGAITFKSGSSTTMALSSANGIVLSSNKSITMSGGNIVMTGGQISLTSGQSNISLTPTNISMSSTGGITMTSGVSGDETIFSITRGEVSLYNATFKQNPYVDGHRMLTDLDLNYNIYVGKNQPTAGNHTIWIDPNDTVEIDYGNLPTLGSRSTASSLTRSTGSHPAVEISYDDLSTTRLSGSTFTYTLTVPLKALNIGGPYNLTVLASIRNTYGSVSFNSQTISMGNQSAPTLTFIVQSTTNLTGVGQFTVHIERTDTVETLIYVESNTNMTLRAASTGAGGGVQACDVKYVP